MKEKIIPYKGYDMSVDKSSTRVRGVYYANKKKAKEAIDKLIKLEPGVRKVKND